MMSRVCVRVCDRGATEHVHVYARLRMCVRARAYMAEYHFALRSSMYLYY